MSIVAKAPESFAVRSVPDAEAFLNELLSVCARHGLALVPVARDGTQEMNFHDAMRVVPLESDITDFYEQSDVCVTTTNTK